MGLLLYGSGIGVDRSRPRLMAFTLGLGVLPCWDGNVPPFQGSGSIFHVSQGSAALHPGLSKYRPVSGLGLSVCKQIPEPKISDIRRPWLRGTEKPAFQFWHFWQSWHFWQFFKLFPFPQPRSLQLARGRTRQFGHELNGPRILVRRDLGLYVVLQFLP